METTADQLLRGAIDLHCHGYPETSLEAKSRVDDVEALQLARRAGMRALVLKSHLWPTTSRVYYLQERVPGIQVFGSITLNPSSGGLSPWVVEAAASQGAKVVWLPTWNAVHDVKSGGFSRRLKEWYPSFPGQGTELGLRVVDASGRLITQVAEILAKAKELGLVLSTGHLSPEESLQVAAETERIGFERLVFGHPLSGNVGASLEQMQEMAARGAYVEFCALGAFSPFARRVPAHQVAEFISALGAKRCIISTDSFFDWPPPPPELLRLFLASLLHLGIGGGDIAIMVRENPARLLGLAPEEE